MSASEGRSAFALSFQLSPIILTNGIAGYIPGAMLPIISITEALNFNLGILSGSDGLDPNDFFANFQVMPGGSLVNNQIGQYPFANQAVAANAIIAQPLQVAVRMLCPVQSDRGGWASKIATMIALQTTLVQHNNSGGTYTIATPSFYYTDCIMLGLRDVTAQTRQSQAEWQFDFIQPLLTETQAQRAMGALMQKISDGTPFTSTPNWSGPGVSVGNLGTLATPNFVPAASNTAGSSIGFPGAQPVSL